MENRPEHAGQPCFVLFWYLEWQRIYKTNFYHNSYYLSFYSLSLVSTTRPHLYNYYPS